MKYENPDTFEKHYNEVFSILIRLYFATRKVAKNQLTQSQQRAVEDIIVVGNFLFTEFADKLEEFKNAKP